jgi:hypothetical protein
LVVARATGVEDLALFTRLLPARVRNRIHLG